MAVLDMLAAAAAHIAVALGIHRDMSTAATDTADAAAADMALADMIAGLRNIHLAVAAEDPGCTLGVPRLLQPASSTSTSKWNRTEWHWEAVVSVSSCGL